jgi:hypothetical protein
MVPRIFERSSGRWRHGGPVLAVLVLVAALVGAVAAAPGADAATAVTVSPADGLSGGDVVTIEAAGFVPGTVAGWCQGVDPPGAASFDDCGVNTTYSRTVEADGSFTGQAAVERFIYVPSLGRWVDCAEPAEGCGIGAAAADDVAGTAAFAPVAFAPVADPPATKGTIVITPETQVAGGAVTVTGSGFRPNARIDLFQCAPGATDQTACGLARVWWASTDDAGAFEVATTVGARVQPAGGSATSCVAGDPALRCLVAVGEAADVPGTFVAAPVSILPGEVAVTPSSDVVLGPTVASVAGSSFPPGAELGICLGVTPTRSLRWWPLTSRGVSQVGFCGTTRDFAQDFETATVAPDGTFSLPELRLERYVYVYDEDRVVDCADPAESCFVHVFAMDDVEATLVSVAVDAATPPPPPADRGAITVTPTAGLTGGDLLTVDGTGFRPGALVDLYRCEAGATDRGRCERLQTDGGEPASVVADDLGALPTTTLRMPAGTFFYRFSWPEPDPYDCTTGSCSITAAEAVDFAGTATEARIAYGPSALPRIVPGAATVVEGNVGDLVLEIPVALSAPSGATVTAQWRTLFGPGVEPPAAAEPGVDFEAGSGTVTFAPGETSATIEMGVTGDVLDEPDEFIVVSLTNPTNARMGGYWGLGFGVIGDDDAPPTVVPGLGTLAEGDDGETVLEVPVTLSAPSGRTVTAQWRTLFGPGVEPPAAAEPGVDFEAGSGTVTFAPGEISATISFLVTGDVLDEPDEYIVASFTHPTNARMGGYWGLGFGLLIDDD